MNGLLGCLELYSTMNMSIDPSVSRRVYFLLVGEQSLVDYWFLDLQLSIALQDVGMRWRRVSSNIYAHSLLALRHIQPHQPFLQLMAPGQAIKARMLAICGGFRSHLCFDDWLDRPCCRFSRHKDAKALSYARMAKRPCDRDKFGF
jgi:hypothetical protein